MDKKLFTNNEIRSWYNSPRGKGWAVYKSYKNQLERLIKESVVQGGLLLGLGPPRVKKLVKVKYITRKLQDKDNFYASLKPLMDALVDLECIKDDSPEWCDLHAVQVTDWNQAYRVMIEIL